MIDFNTNITSKSKDLKEIFYPYVSGSIKAPITNLIINGKDLNEIFQNINVPPSPSFTYTIQDESKFTVVTNSDNTQYTFVFTDYTTATIDNPVIDINQITKSIIFSQNVNATITIIGEGGGGGSNNNIQYNGGGGSLQDELCQSRGGLWGRGGAGYGTCGNDGVSYNGPNGIYYSDSISNENNGYPGTAGGECGWNGQGINLIPGANGSCGLIIIQINNIN